MRRLVLMLAALVCLAAPAAAVAEEVPPFDGLMAFQAIQGPEGPEEFSWEVKLGEEEELRQVDETHAGVFWVGEETMAMGITAQRAHDAEGANVPTTLTVTAPNLITLTVRHRAGNPAGGGAPFVYPVVAGEGWEGGFQTYEVQMPPPTETAAPQQGAPACLVPDLAGRSLKAARRQLRRAHCKLGPVRGERSRRARVVRQYRRAGRSLLAGAEVGVKLAA